MKFNCGPTLWERRKEWHIWFAWYPVRVGLHEKRWLEFVYRRMRSDAEGRIVAEYKGVG